MRWGFAVVVSVLVASAQTPNSDERQHVLSQMDQTAANFTTAQAAFEWDQYQKVVDEHDFQKGMVYFRRVGSEVQMAADISDPKPPKYVLFTDSKVEVYQPKIDQVTTYNTGKDRATIESFLVLGFGGSGKDISVGIGSNELEELTRTEIPLCSTIRPARRLYSARRAFALKTAGIYLFRRCHRRALT